MSLRLRSPWPLAAAALAAVVAATVAFVVMALLGAEFSCTGGGAGVASGPAPAGAAAREIPAARLRLYVGAGRRFDISWPFLASIGVQECGADGRCAEVSPSGCAGPMQMAYVRGSACSPDPAAPTIWERFRVDGDGDGRMDIFDAADSIFTAAHFMRADLGAPPAGGPYSGYFQAACHYYGACADSVADYAHEVMARAVRYGFGHEAELKGVGAEAGPPAPQGPACEGGAASGASGSAIVRIAERQLGTPEAPLGSNCTKYGPCEEWCALFVAWVWQHAGIQMAGGTAPYAYSGTIGEWVKAHGGRLLPPSATPAPGDAVLYGWGPQASEHVGIVERVLGGQITTIDGNFGNEVARVGPFPPALAVLDGEPGPIYAYAQPPGAGPSEGGGRRG
jgi:hypothetical protein